MTLHPIPSVLPFTWGNLVFFFISEGCPSRWRADATRQFLLLFFVLKNLFFSPWVHFPHWGVPPDEGRRDPGGCGGQPRVTKHAAPQNPLWFNNLPTWPFFLIFSFIHAHLRTRDTRDCWNWGEWGLKEYKWKGSFLGWACRAGYKRFLSGLGSSSRPSAKYLFPLFIYPHHPASWAGSRAGSPVSYSM